MRAATFRRLAAVAWIMQALIVASGAAVRLTEAGLGCEDWPSCNEDRVLPEWQLHGLIEFGNRVISLFVVLSAVAVVVAAYRRLPRRSDLIGYAWAVLGGTVAQVVLGGITVLLDLHPIVVSGHFIVSMGLLWAAQMLWLRSGSGWDVADGDSIEPATAGGRSALDANLVRGQLALATAVLLTGTVVTGTGPHSGDSRADRLDFQLEAVARIHSSVVWCLVAVLVLLAVRRAQRLTGTSEIAGARDSEIAGERDGGESASVASSAVLVDFPSLQWLLVAVVAQGAIGYTQFALGVPALLVEIHVIGAVTVWTLAIMFHHRSFHRRRSPRRAAADALAQRA